MYKIPPHNQRRTMKFVLIFTILMLTVIAIDDLAGRARPTKQQQIK